jgi:hypothetical protein
MGNSAGPSFVQALAPCTLMILFCSESDYHKHLTVVGDRRFTILCASSHILEKKRMGQQRAQRILGRLGNYRTGWQSDSQNLTTRRIQEDWRGEF